MHRLGLALALLVTACGASTPLEVPVCNALEPGAASQRESSLVGYPVAVPRGFDGGPLVDGTYRLVAALRMLPDGGIDDGLAMTLTIRGERWELAWSEDGGPARTASFRARRTGNALVELAALCGASAYSGFYYNNSGSQLLLLSSTPQLLLRLQRG